MNFLFLNCILVAGAAGRERERSENFFTSFPLLFLSFYCTYTLPSSFGGKERAAAKEEMEKGGRISYNLMQVVVFDQS